ncbi:MAG: hypothetical protein OEU26_17570 [Candidatus Tectomicrobia bacterium]|nr:hypothetical protein [Candidatus Tectomicrobia bacterium]
MPSKLMKTLFISLTTVGMLSVYGLSLSWAGGGQTLPVKQSEEQTPTQSQLQVVQSTSSSSQMQLAQQPRRQAVTKDQDSTSKSYYQTMKESITEPGKFELGVIGGDPLGVSAKLWLTPTRAIDAGVGWTLIGDDTNLQLHADYLFHNFDLVKVDKGSLPVYSGLGTRFRFGEDSRFGIRVPIGAQYITASRTFSLFLEVAPIISFIPEAEVDLNVGLGIRFFFFE